MTPVDVEGNLDLWKKVNHKNKFFVINKANSSKAGRPANYDFLRSKMVQIGKISSEEIPYVEDLSETTVAAIPIFDIPRLANQSSKTFALWTFKKAGMHVGALLASPEGTDFVPLQKFSASLRRAGCG